MQGWLERRRLERRLGHPLAGARSLAHPPPWPSTPCRGTRAQRSAPARRPAPRARTAAPAAAGDGVCRGVQGGDGRGVRHEAARGPQPCLPTCSSTNQRRHTPHPPAWRSSRPHSSGCRWPSCRGCCPSGTRAPAAGGAGGSGGHRRARRQQPDGCKRSRQRSMQWSCCGHAAPGLALTMSLSSIVCTVNSAKWCTAAGQRGAEEGGRLVDKSGAHGVTRGSERGCARWLHAAAAGASEAV